MSDAKRVDVPTVVDSGSGDLEINNALPSCGQQCEARGVGWSPQDGQGRKGSKGRSLFLRSHQGFRSRVTGS